MQANEHEELITSSCSSNKRTFISLKTNYMQKYKTKTNLCKLNCQTNVIYAFLKEYLQEILLKIYHKFPLFI